jgi:hypothetical protein
MVESCCIGKFVTANKLILWIIFKAMWKEDMRKGVGGERDGGLWLLHSLSRANNKTSRVLVYM